MENNTVQQTENFVEIIGILKKKDINFGVSTKSGTEKNYANGHIEVEVSTAAGVNVLKVNVMQMELKADGNVNKNYKALQTIANEYKAKDECGEEADTIRVVGKIEENNFYSKEDDEVRENVQIVAAANFDKGEFAPISRVEKNTEHKAIASFGGFISKVINNEATGDLKVTIIGSSYNGQAIVNTLDVSKDLAPQFQAIYQQGMVATFHYQIINAVEIKEVVEQVTFGVAPSRTIRKVSRKNLIVGANSVDYNSKMNEEVVRQMLTVRNVKLEKVKEEGRNKENKTSSSTVASNGSFDMSKISSTFGMNPFANN